VTAPAPHVVLHDDGSLTVRFTAEQRKVIESRDRCSQGSLCDRMAEQLFVSQVVQLTRTEQEARHV
jgi:hypothetical protein